MLNCFGRYWHLWLLFSIIIMLLCLEWGGSGIGFRRLHPKCSYSYNRSIIQFCSQYFYAYLWIFWGRATQNQFFKDHIALCEGDHIQFCTLQCVHYRRNGALQFKNCYFQNNTSKLLYHSVCSCLFIQSVYQLYGKRITGKKVGFADLPGCDCFFHRTYGG